MQLNSNLYMGSHQNVPYYATRPASQPSSINPGQSQIRFVNNNAVSQIYYTNPHELSRRKPGESLINKYYPMETIHYSFVNDKFRTSYITS